jgi:hypothetical protein
MQYDAQTLYQVARERQNDLAREVQRDRGTHLVWPRPWRDPAVWSLVLGPIVGTSFLLYFAREIVSAAGRHGG